jgi:hypothetical protein
MLDNTITVPVDLLNNDSTTDAVYTRYQEFLNRSVYISAAHLMELRDTISFYRSMPTVNGNFKGVSKSSFKITVDQEVDGVDSSTSLTAPAIVEVSFSIPVGTTAAKQLILRQIAVAMLDDDSLMLQSMERLEV